MYQTSKYYSYIFYTSRNVRPCTILGYTLTTFPKSRKTLLHNQSNRNLWHNCKSSNKAENNKNKKNLHRIAGVAPCTEMMRALNNPWNPKGRKTSTPVGVKIAPLVYFSESGTPVEGQPTKEEGNEKSVGINMSALDKTELVPDNLSQVKNPASPVKFIEEVMNGAALKVEPKETSLLKMLGFEAQEERNLEPDFYMPDGRGGKLSEIQCVLTTERTPEDNPGAIVKLENLKEKYGPSLYLLDKRSGNLYMLETEGYKKIEEKGLLFPSESMILAGALEREIGEPQPSMQISKMQATPAAESTRIPLRTSTEKREKSLTSEQLLDL